MMWRTSGEEERKRRGTAAGCQSQLGYLSLFFLCLGALSVSCYAFYLYYGTPDASRYLDSPALLPAVKRSRNFSVDLQAPLHVVDDQFVSFNLDAALFARSWDWLELDLGHPRLVALCRSLSPALLRVGGATSNLLMFSEKNRTQPDRDLDWKNNVLYPEYRGPLVMYGDDWLKLNRFVSDVGWELLFSLNGLNRLNGAWDSSNAVRLLRFSDLHKLNVHWQLGSELEASGLVRPEELARDYAGLRHLLLFWQAKSRLVGPELKNTSAETLAFFDSFIEEGHKSLDVVTFHHYSHKGPYKTPSELLNGSVLQELKKSVQQVLRALKRNGLRKPLWITEAASGLGDDLLPVSGTYASALAWLDTLGSAAKQGVSLVARQSLLQGASRLLDERFSPLPDFWLSLFHKRLVGGRVLRLRAQPGTDPVRLYAHCLRDGAVKGRRGAVVLLAVNLSNDTVLLRPKDPELRASHVMQYALGPKGLLDLLSEDVQLNGRLLAINDKLQFPDIVPVVLHPTQPLILKPHGAAFFVFADYRAPACTATF